MWLAGRTRSDIANAVRVVARHLHDPRERHWKAAVKILAYLESTRDLGITFEKRAGLELAVFETNTRSVSGVAVLLGGGCSVYK